MGRTWLVVVEEPRRVGREGGEVIPGAFVATRRPVHARLSAVCVRYSMQAHGSRVWELLAPGSQGGGGGYFYVCGDASRMAKDVHKTLVAVAASASGCSQEAAAALVEGLVQEKRYLRDVW